MCTQKSTWLTGNGLNPVTAPGKLIKLVRMDFGVQTNLAEKVKESRDAQSLFQIKKK